MLVWAALPFGDEFLTPVFESGSIVFPREGFTQFYKTIDNAIARGREASDGHNVWVAQVEINQDDMLEALNDFSFYLATEKANNRNSDQMPEGIRATIKQKVLYKG